MWFALPAPSTFCAAEDGLELLIFLTLPPKCRDLLVITRRLLTSSPAPISSPPHFVSPTWFKIKLYEQLVFNLLYQFSLLFTQLLLKKVKALNFCCEACIKLIPELTFSSAFSSEFAYSPQKRGLAIHPWGSKSWVFLGGGIDLSISICMS